MDNWVELIESLALAGTMLITIVNLFATSALTRSQQQSGVMSAMRSERIDKMREHSAGIITCCEYLFHDLAEDDTKRDLLHHGHSLISLLQYYYEYTEDIELIKTTHEILEHCLKEDINKAELAKKVKYFWWLCNVYTGADFERLKNESLGRIHRGGKSQAEATDFHKLFDKFNADIGHFFPEKAPSQTPKKEIS